MDSQIVFFSILFFGFGLMFEDREVLNIFFHVTTSEEKTEKENNKTF